MHFKLLPLTLFISLSSSGVLANDEALPPVAEPQLAST